jgi:hypothetical protein
MQNTKLSRILKSVYKNEDYDKKNIGFISKIMLYCLLPHSRTKDVIITKEYNNFRFTITGNPFIKGIAYGTYPRLILSFIITHVVRTRSREILLGKNISDFMRSLDIPITGANIARLKKQMLMLFSMSFSMHKIGDKDYTISNMSIVDESVINIEEHNKSNNFDIYESMFFKSKILLGEKFYNQIINSPIPINTHIMRLIKDSSLAIDIYFWLTYRFSNLKKEVNINFDLLFNQFSNGYQNTSKGRYEFKKQFIKQIKNVKAAYKEADVKIFDEFILLKPSEPSVRSITKTNPSSVTI